MRLFHNVVGFEGASHDFPRTIEAPVSLGTLKYYRSSNFVGKKHGAKANAFFWGVPQGAQSIFALMKPGDIICLFESSSDRSRRSYIAEINSVSNKPLSKLSSELWLSERFPLIFTLSPIELDLSWRKFKMIVGYSANYRNNLLGVVSESRIINTGGIDRILSLLVDNIFLNERNGLSLESLPQIKDLRSESIIKRKIRLKSFREKVLSAYGRKCAVCGMNYENERGHSVLDAAHIYQVSNDGSDDVRNGIALCKNHHWAFDNNLFIISEDYTLEVAQFYLTHHSQDELSKRHGELIQLPSQRNLWPHRDFLRARKSQTS